MTRNHFVVAYKTSVAAESVHLSMQDEGSPTFSEPMYNTQKKCISMSGGSTCPFFSASNVTDEGNSEVDADNCLIILLSCSAACVTT